jgi:hypothetical protein
VQFVVITILWYKIMWLVCLDGRTVDENLNVDVYNFVIMYV